MPYCLIGKITVWIAGIALFALLAYALAMACDHLMERHRARLLPSSRETFLFEDVFGWIADILGDALDCIGLQHLNARLQDKVLGALFLPLFIIFVPPAFLELGLRYALYRLRTPAAPAALA